MDSGKNKNKKKFLPIPSISGEAGLSNKTQRACLSDRNKKREPRFPWNSRGKMDGLRGLPAVAQIPDVVVGALNVHELDL
jgi:hypothetical protein